MPDELDDLPPDEAIDYAQRLLDEGRAFGAHEVLEAVWKSAPDTERELWRSLAQLAVGVTHLQRGNLRGAQELSRRGATGLGPFRAGAQYGLRIDDLARAGEELAEAIAAGQVPSVPRLRLRR
ncbi:MAG TPA: DUF309 domain-containing protein [Frankiaceae bacterium]|nr:DUF309 domain-containing protein [Frankiaceae bacterium]